MVGGDFNSVVDNLDKIANVDKSSKKTLLSFTKKLDLCDIWRAKHPNEREYTFIDPSGRGHNSRIDMLLSTEHIYKKVKSCHIVNAPTPDHKAVKAEIILKQNTRGKGYWKLNSSVIKDQEYQELIKDTINKTYTEYKDDISKCQLWEFLKLRLKEESIRYCILKAQDKKDEIKRTELQIDLLDRELAKKPLNHKQLTEERTLLKQTLNRLYSDKARGAQVRSRARWVEQGEKSTAYFLNLEKIHQSHNSIESITYKNKNSKENKGILELCTEFYKDLYSSKQVSDEDINEFTDSITLEHALTNEEQEICEGHVTIEECDKAISKMKLNKAPGLDGLTIEFYKCFWSFLKDMVVDAFNESYDLECLPESMRIAIMTLIFKKGDLEDLENYRPISLMNVDYKILAFVLAARIQKVINILISPDQVAYIQERYIGTNVRLILDVINESNRGLLFFLDFKKAFDSLEWNFIFKCLKKYNFGESIIQWIKLLYVKPLACIKNNGYISETFEIQRGVRQGCPVSCLIFILCVEFLAQSIRENRQIQGIKLDTSNIKICQYADDATVFLKNENELSSCIEVINNFGKASGMKLNKSKCEGLWLGDYAERQTNCTLLGIKWPPGPIKCLGIYVGNDERQCTKCNWHDKLDKMENMLEKWKKRELTLFGKVQVIKSLALASLIYTASCCVIPTGFIEKVNKVLFSFIWGKVERIKRNSLIGQKDVGGIGMIDIKSQFEALKAAWVPRILMGENTHHWKELATKYINRLGENYYILRTSIDEVKKCLVLNTMPEIYQEMVVAFTKSKIVTEDNIYNQTLFANRLLTCKSMGRVISPYFINWIKSGISNVKDLRLINGVIDEHYMYEHLNEKHNVYVEISQMQKCLNPYKRLLGSNEPGEDKTDVALYNVDWSEIDIVEKKSKYFYQNILKQKHESPNLETFWTDKFGDIEIDFKCVYHHKIVGIKDIKLAETNFKILYNILPCGEKLVKWKKIESAECSVCNAIENVTHLIYNCNYSKQIWAMVNNVLGINVTLQDVILGNNISIEENFIVSLIVYLIYKEWLTLSFKGKGRTQYVNWRYLKNELIWYTQIYNCIDLLRIHVPILERFIELL